MDICDFVVQVGVVPRVGQTMAAETLGEFVAVEVAASDLFSFS